MTPKERLLRTLRGQETDRRPWSPFLAYWWENNSGKYGLKSQLEFMESVGADPLLRGFATPYTVKRNNFEFKAEDKGNVSYQTMETPVGTLNLKYTYSSAGNTSFITEHPVKTVEDLKILTYIFENSEVIPDKNFNESYSSLGERALLLPLVGAMCKTCFQSLVETWVGTVNLTYLIEDEPDEVENCLEAMRKISYKTADIDAETNADAFIFWEDSSTTNISPAMFKKYAAPEIEYWGNTFHAAGKMLVHHACGHLHDLIKPMGELPIDSVESISPPPTGNIDIKEAFTLIPEHVSLIGGIEPVFFQNCTLAELEERVYNLLKISENRRFVLANSDSCPPAVEIEKFAFVTDCVKKYYNK